MYNIDKQQYEFKLTFDGFIHEDEDKDDSEE
jgi:hypothetical protein